MGRLPNFLLIGASKCGTTSLHSYLDQHPDVFMSPLKEPAFFAFEGWTAFPETDQHGAPYIVDLEAYQALFDGVRDERAIGESSPQYLEFAGSSVIERIAHYIPDVRLIAVLRHPVDRAYSAYSMYTRDNVATIKRFAMRFRQDCARDDDFGQQFDGTKNYARSCATRISAFAQRFGNERLKVCLYEDLAADTPTFMRELFRFLDVDDGVSIDVSERHNETAMLKDRGTRYLLLRPNPVRYLARKLLPEDLRVGIRERIERLRQKKPAKLDPELRRDLTLLLRPEIERLEEILGRDLSHWLD